MASFITKEAMAERLVEKIGTHGVSRTTIVYMLTALRRNELMAMYEHHFGRGATAGTIDTLNEWIGDLRRENNSDAAIAFDTALRAITNCSVSPSSARVAIPVLEEHLGDAQKDGNSALVAALTDGLTKLNEVCL